MYGTTVGLSAQQVCSAPAMPSPNGLHNTANQVVCRIASANDRLVKILGRIRGAQPSQTSNGNDKLLSEPSLLSHLGSANVELSRLESFIEELNELIG
jgi:hypothetical protein